MRGLVRILALGASAVVAFAAAPAAALTLTFAVHVTGSSPGAPAIDDFEMTWTFEPVLYEFGGQKTYYGDVAGVVATPQGADMFAVAGVSEPYAPPPDSWALNRTMDGDNVYVEFYQRFRSADLDAERLGDYQNQIAGGGLFPAVNYTPGGFVYLVQSLGDLQWSQTALQTVGGFTNDGPPLTVVGERLYTGTARLVAWDVEPDPPAVPEPATWALMIVGFGLVGSTLRRRFASAAG
ncbi:PEPxxWA-CTERM sorting domain-containing protein [Phenylobacterium sp.]|uniref:PEPxxWA-CTERM sorting domain-containing protein n=1 Tax=Phenylobacterium sp. TaxID=1871053 RepID=UPI0025F5F900|nr:PEPxxWA-CTERM sorting domain-containing protein [Phenylobacterium sp.]